uniref:Sperm-tail PG-rich repeat-containing protein 2 n=1 Tax=Alexandrium monilatum TaxID=311494 RepID=A0A7S4PY89_9DINO
MAWTSRADRFVPPAQNDPVGPGSYGGHPEHHPEPHYAPFGSSKPRTTTNPDFGSQDVPRSTSPPPGAYDPKLPQAYDSGLPKKHVPFSTGAPRSTGVPKAEKARPGPGAYNIGPRLPEALSCRTMGAPPADHPPLLKSTSAPSIPCRHQSHGYEEAGDGRLLRNTARDGHLHYSGKSNDTVGPGHYGHEGDGTRGRVLNGRILPEAASRQETATDTPGPGHYDTKRSKQSAVTSSFVSTCAQRPKGKEKAKMPGPGSYDPHAVSRSDLREVYADMQYFGSTVERFRDPILEQAPGPGHYAERKRDKAKSSWIKSDRFQTEGGKQALAMPGPGQYSPGATDGKTSGPLGTVSLLGSTGCLAFGSMESKRFSGLKSEGPGPGAYYSDSQDEPSTSSKMGRSGRRMTAKPMRSHSAVFLSETPLNAYTLMAIKEGKQRPPPGAYTPTLARDVGTVMRQPPKAEGFLSAESRGKGDPMGQRSTAPGPGRYNTVIDVTGGKKLGTFNRTIAEGAPSRGRPQGLGFESQTRRFRGPAGAKETPGPGAYETEPDWITKTHNIHFGDVG